MSRPGSVLPCCYVLDAAGEPLVETDTLKWALWCEGHWRNRHVDCTCIGHFTVSTIFLALDMAFTEPEPVLWEMQVAWQRRGRQRTKRYILTTERCGGPRATAIAMHRMACADVRAGRYFFC